MINRTQTNRGAGLIRTLVIVAVILIVLAYFGFNLRSIVASSTFQDNWLFIKEVSLNVWNNYLKVVVDLIWNNIITPIIFKKN